MSRDLPRWVLVVIVLACVAALIVWARGREHHRGLFEGALEAPLSAAHRPAG
jgi:hypothetical protein